MFINNTVLIVDKIFIGRYVEDPTQNALLIYLAGPAPGANIVKKSSPWVPQNCAPDPECITWQVQPPGLT